MNEGGALLPWLVIRQDDNGNRYRVGRCATQREAEKMAEGLGLGESGPRQYWVERAGQTTS
jgi:hypothetical protein